MVTYYDTKLSTYGRIYNLMLYTFESDKSVEQDVLRIFTSDYLYCMTGELLTSLAVIRTNRKCEIVNAYTDNRRDVCNAVFRSDDRVRPGSLDQQPLRRPLRYHSPFCFPNHYITIGPGVVLRQNIWAGPVPFPFLPPPLPASPAP